MGAALTIKEEAIFCSNMLLGLGFGESFGSLPLYIDNKSALHVAGNRTYSSRAKHIALRCYFSCKNCWRARSASSTSRARISWWTWAPSTIASTATAISSSSSTSLRLKTPTSLSTSKERPSFFCARNLTYFSRFSAYFVVIYRGSRTLHCSFLAGSSR